MDRIIKERNMSVSKTSPNELDVLRMTEMKSSSPIYVRNQNHLFLFKSVNVIYFLYLQFSYFNLFKFILLFIEIYTSVTNIINIFSDPKKLFCTLHFKNHILHATRNPIKIIGVFF